MDSPGRCAGTIFYALAREAFIHSLDTMKNPSLLTLPAAVGITALLLCSCGDSQQPIANTSTVDTVPSVTAGEPAGIAKYTGTYSFGSDPAKEATGTLMVYPLNADMAVVHLDVQNGAPAHNSGSLTQSVHVHNDSAWIWIDNNDDGECRIALYFTENDVIAKTYAVKGCEFGANVTADHVYKRTSREKPQYFFNGQGDTMRFKEIAEKGLAMPAH